MINVIYTDLCLVLIALVLLFPADCIIFAGIVRAWVFSRILNYYLMFQAWRMYRQIRADMTKMGVPVPPFKFVPIWQRQPLPRKP